MLRLRWEIESSAPAEEAAAPEGVASLDDRRARLSGA
jgi:hypothetical protein